MKSTTKEMNTSFTFSSVLSFTFLEYISPEMVLSKPHNRAVDIWAFGIFIFELLTRSTPFDHPTTVS